MLSVCRRIPDSLRACPPGQDHLNSCMAALLASDVSERNRNRNGQTRLSASGVPPTGTRGCDRSTSRTARRRSLIIPYCFAAIVLYCHQLSAQQSAQPLFPQAIAIVLDISL